MSIKLWYLDYDLDGWMMLSGRQCDQPTGYSDNDLDCDDLDDSVTPNATEICDGIDNDCDAVIDDGATIGDSEECMATSCAEIKTTTLLPKMGLFIEDLNGDPLEVFCEMDFLGGGWVAVYNMVHTANLRTKQRACAALIRTGHAALSIWHRRLQQSTP